MNNAKGKYELIGEYAQPPVEVKVFRGNHLSNTTCLTQAFFKSGEECSTLWCSLTRRKTHKTSEVRQVALDK